MALTINRSRRARNSFSQLPCVSERTYDTSATQQFPPKPCTTNRTPTPNISMPTGFIWSGRGDLNAGPPAPKADCGRDTKSSIFSTFRFKQMASSC
jgi:hypothetical protein